MNIKILLLSVIICFIGCSNQKADEEKIEYMYSVKNQKSDGLENMGIPSFTIKNEYWKRGTNIIAYINKVVINTVDSITETKTEFFKCVFFNFEKKLIREYASLTDTATVQNEYPFSDSTSLSGVWDFRKEFIIDYKTQKNLPDTVIEKVLYKRKRYTRQIGQTESMLDAYFDCSKPRSQFELSANLGNEFNCAHVKTFTYMPDGITISHISEVIFLPVVNKSVMNKIFDSWGK